MVTLTGSLSSPREGAWLMVGGALGGEVVRGEDARGNARVGPARTSINVQNQIFIYLKQ